MQSQEKNEATEVTSNSLRELLRAYQESWNPAIVDLSNVKYTKRANIKNVFPGSLIIRENVRNPEIRMVCFVHEVRENKVKYYDWMSPMTMDTQEFDHYNFWHFDQNTVRRVNL